MSLSTTMVVNQGESAAEASVSWKILDASGNQVATAEAPAQSVAADGASSSPPPQNLRLPRSGRLTLQISTLLWSTSRQKAKFAMPRTSPLACAPPNSRPIKAFSSTGRTSRFRAPATTMTTPALAQRFQIGSNISALPCSSRWAAMAFVPRITCRLPSGCRPVSAWV